METIVQKYKGKINETKRTITLQKIVNPKITINMIVENGMIKKIKNKYNVYFPFKIGQKTLIHQIQNFGNINGYKIIGEAKMKTKIIKPKEMTLTEAINLIKKGYGRYYGSCGHFDHSGICNSEGSKKIMIFMNEECQKCKQNKKTTTLTEQIMANSKGDGFVPKTKNKKFNIILEYRKYPREKFDVLLEPREYKSEQTFLSAVLDDIPLYKLPYLIKMSVLQYFTSNPNQLPDYLKKNKGVFKFK